jgi:hypothetical protein
MFARLSMISGKVKVKSEQAENVIKARLGMVQKHLSL